MKFSVQSAAEILSATPGTVRAMTAGLSADWTGGPADGQREKWEVYDVLGHLIHGEETDWVPRAEIVLAQGESRTFVPFDRFAQFAGPKSKTISELLDEFENLRQKNLETLRSWDPTEDQLELKGMHPELGEVTLRQLLATWVVHDLNHIRQIANIMAVKFADEVGPWKQNLGILD